MTAAAALATCGWLTTLAPAGGEQTQTVAIYSARTEVRPAVAHGGGGFSVLAGEVLRPSVKAPEEDGGVDCRRRKCIALTFDDGPMKPTARLLGILAGRQAKATFFLVGQNVVANPELVRQERDSGHELANHSYTHADLGRSPDAKVRSEIGRTQEAVRRVSGVTPRLFRPPYGSTDRGVAAVARKHGLPQILWSLDTSDWQDRDTEVVERRVVGGARPGAVVLMHDIHRTTVAAVPGILKKLAAKGYVFVTVSELFHGRRLVPGKEYTRR